jgi:hypothetical protein
MIPVPTTVNPDESAAEDLPIVGELRDVGAPAGALIVRHVLHEGVRTGQLSISDHTLTLSDTASASFISSLAAAIDDPIVRSPALSAVGGRPSAYQDHIRKSMADQLARYLTELAAAERAINEKYAQAGFLGDPVSDVEFGGRNYDVSYRKYEYGAIYNPPVGGPFEVTAAVVRYGCGSSSA